MKKIYSILILLAILCSCSNDLGEFLEEETTQQHTCRLYMNGGISGYADEPQSRASVTVQNGTVMYLTFPNDVKGQAVYNNGSWTVSYSGTITSGKCSAYCFPGSTAASGNTVSLNNVPGYGTTDGICTVAANGDITLQANLTPLYPRIRFKGASGTKVKSSSMVTVVTGFSVSTAAIMSTKLDYSGTVGSNGYTSYVYYYDPASANLVLEVDGKKYTSIQCIPAENDSYALVLPTPSSHSGWVMEGEGGSTPSIGPYNGHDYVDLGLSVKWATCNVGATKPEEYGDYYAWGETETKSTYDWSTYLDSPNHDGKSFRKYATDKKKVLDPEDDAVTTIMGNGCRIPTKDEFEELIKNCTWTYNTEIGSVSGYTVTGMNGNSIYLPAGGYYDDMSPKDVKYANELLRYWTSSAESNAALSLRGNKQRIDKRAFPGERCCGYLLRGVKDNK